MTPVDKGRFCDSCQKKVFDFTTASDREILKKFPTDGNLCGRFLNAQLNRELVDAKEKSKLWGAVAASAMAILNCVPQKTTAQTRKWQPVTEQHAQKTKPSGPLRQIKGQVSNELGPLQNAAVTIKNTTTSATTDDLGRFSLSVHSNDILVVNAIGYGELEVRVLPTQNHYDITLEETTIVLQNYLISTHTYVTAGGAMAVCADVVQREHKHTFVGRILCPVVNIFRSKEKKHP